MLLLFLVNKPLTLFLYLLGILLLFLYAMYIVDLRKWEVLLFMIFSIIDYSFIYNIWLWYTLINDKEEIKIKGVDIRRFVPFIVVYFFIYLIVLINLLAFDVQILVVPIVVLVYTIISYVLFKILMLSKFVSLVLKANPNLKDLKFEDWYEDVRKVLLKKVIS
jgi:hypothetical protein